MLLHCLLLLVLLYFSSSLSCSFFSSLFNLFSIICFFAFSTTLFARFSRFSCRFPLHCNFFKSFSVNGHSRFFLQACSIFISLTLCRFPRRCEPTLSFISPM